jgi:CCR4-NOT transcription complex subunit 4
VGVYVTFARKEDAEKCINAVDGSQNGERTLRYVNIFPCIFAM